MCHYKLWHQRGCGTCCGTHFYAMISRVWTVLCHCSTSFLYKSLIIKSRARVETQRMEKVLGYFGQTLWHSGAVAQACASLP